MARSILHNDSDDLPASFRAHNHALLSPNAELQAFLESDLCIEIYNDLDHHLWLAGRPYPPRPLNIHGVLNRQIIPTTEASLHLVWTTNKIYIKALPSYLLTPRFYDDHLSLPEPDGRALGLLYSYMALLPTTLDFAIARDHHLIPDSLEWKSWQALTRRVLQDYPRETIYGHLPRRYVYGELRLSRLDKICRLYQGKWLHGFSNLTGNTRYVDFFSEYLHTIAFATAYIVVVLTAMQVGLATDSLSHDAAFQSASYGFTVFSIISPVIAVSIIVGLIVIMFFANYFRTVNTLRRRSAQIEVSLMSRDNGKVKHQLPNV